MLPEAATYLAYLGAIALLMITPGPDMMFVLANAGRWGVRAGVAAAVGVAAGEAVHVAAAAVGLASLFAANPVLYQVVRYAGAGYLVWLGIRALRHRADTARPQSGESGWWRSFRRGLVTNVLNPKMALFTVAFLPQFIDPARGFVTGQLLVLGATFIAVQLTVDLGLALLAGRFGDRWLRRPSVARRINTVTGTVFIGLGARLATLG
ncbi:threonine/homoserine/homoserine lactone efflux protein [Stackebrandtia albiflava]|uniref:Threonine/homoserine/homoserine lactone efflux protein n=1 Tax=Stackebrandtia albiflava TaxID=406432 RepID=A0A562V4W6_9ACTN|nr:LysE family translocator [Stackebrandtia albiflava]TWJ12934.1 threonine/homoserine/homoserine lactone efflux protein [Stackebrandtia albiflava]